MRGPGGGAARETAANNVSEATNKPSNLPTKYEQFLREFDAPEAPLRRATECWDVEVGDGTPDGQFKVLQRLCESIVNHGPPNVDIMMFVAE